MLSRVANSVYWMCRYVERAENVARFVDVARNFELESTDELKPQWEPLVYTSGDHDDFEKRYGTFDQANVVRFLASDIENPNSILRCVAAARENARIIRDTISSEMWSVLNELYLRLKDEMREGRDVSAGGPEVFEAVKRTSQTFLGVMDSTLSHGEAWHFGRMGTFLERADKTSRILDVKYFMLLPSVSAVGSPLDNIHWSALLGSASGLEMFRKKHGLLTPTSVAGFLMLDSEFPRSVYYCMTQVEAALRSVSHQPPGQWSFDGEKALSRICSDLSFKTPEELLEGGLHEFIDDLQDSLNHIDQGIEGHYFQTRA